MAKKFQPGCPCCTPAIPPTPSPVCVSGCNGAAIPGAHVEVRDGHGDVVLDDDTGLNGCTESVLWLAGSYTATVTPPVGVPGWEVTVRNFTMPGGTVLPFPLALSEGYTCGCRAPDRHDYFGVGDPKPNLPETLFFSCDDGACVLNWFPAYPGSRLEYGIYYGYFTKAGALSGIPSRPIGGGIECFPPQRADAVVDVLFNPCGGIDPGQNSDPCTFGDPFPSAFGLFFGTRAGCSCVDCPADAVPSPDDWTFDRRTMLNILPYSNPQDMLNSVWCRFPTGIDGICISAVSPPYLGGYSLTNQPLHFEANFGDVYYNRFAGAGACPHELYLSPGTVIIDE